jgi:hypothetical protein
MGATSRVLELVEDPEALSGIHAVIGMNLVDWGRVEHGLTHFGLSLEHARRTGNKRGEIFALANGARGHITGGRLDEAERWLERSLTLVDEQRWIAFRPWPQALLSQIRLRYGDPPSTVRSRLEDAFALSCQLADPCWEGAAARSIALTHVAEAALTPALDWLSEGRRRCMRETNRYVAIQVEILADQTEISLAQGNTRDADTFAREWLSLAARTHMDAHVTRAAQVITAVGHGR